MYNIRVRIFEERFSVLTRERKIIAAFILGCIIVFILHRGTIATKSDILHAQMIQALSNLIVIFFLGCSIFSGGTLLKQIRLLTVFLLCAGAALIAINVTMMFASAIQFKTYELQLPWILLLVSISVIWLTVMQMALLFNERRHILGETRISDSPYAKRRSPRSSQLLDITLLSSGLLVYIAWFIFPNMAIAVRVLDMAFSLYLLWWMLLQAAHIMFPKQEHHRAND